MHHFEKPLVLTRAKRRNYCEPCGQPTYLDTQYDFYVCKSCGLVQKAYVPYFSYSEHPRNVTVIDRRFMHHRKRLRSNMNRMGIHDESVRIGIKRLFKLAEAHIMLRSDTKRRNIIRYAYLINKFLQLLGRPDLVQPKYFPKGKTLEEYEQVWKGVCEYNGLRYIPAAQKSPSGYKRACRTASTSSRSRASTTPS